MVGSGMKSGTLGSKLGFQGSGQELDLGLRNGQGLVRVVVQNWFYVSVWVRDTAVRAKTQ